MTLLRHLWKQMGNRAFSVLAIHYTSRFSFHSSFSIILIISTVRWVAWAKKKRLGVAGKCVCGWQWCSGYLETVETSNNSIFSITWGMFSEKARKKTTKKTKTAWCRHGLRVKRLLTTAESRAALLFLAFALITCSYVILLFQPCCRGAKSKRPPGTDHLLCALTMEKANVLRNTCYTWRIPGYVLLSSTFFLQSKSFREFTVIKDDIPIYIVYSFILDLSINRPNAERVRSGCWQKAMKGSNFCLLEEHVCLVCSAPGWHLHKICTALLAWIDWCVSIEYTFSGSSWSATLPSCLCSLLESAVLKNISCTTHC